MPNTFRQDHYSQTHSTIINKIFHDFKSFQNKKQRTRNHSNYKFASIITYLKSHKDNNINNNNNNNNNNSNNLLYLRDRMTFNFVIIYRLHSARCNHNVPRTFTREHRFETTYTPISQSISVKSRST